MQCPKCGTKRVFDFEKCPSCGHNMYQSNKSNQTPSPPASGTTQVEAISQQSSPATTAAIQVLKFFAWLDLMAGIFGSVLIWASFGKTVIPGYFSLTETNPVAIGLGFAVLFQGVFCCALFLVIAQIAENLIAIKTNTSHASAAA